MPPTPPTPHNAQVNVKKTRAGKLRRTLGWTLLTLGLLVAGVWVASGWSSFTRFWSKGYLTLDRGTALVVYLRNANIPPNYPAKDVGRFVPTFQWWGDHFYGNDFSFGFVHATIDREGCTVFLILWPVGLGCLAAGGLLLRSGILARWRAMKGLCKKCGYDLAGLAPDAPCPECGNGTRKN